MSYKDLKSYQQATIVYDYTVEFCQKYITNHKITTQMIGAARDGKQNIVEASENKTSEKIKINLLGASRFSLGELLGDYEDFLRQRNLNQWDKNHPESIAVRKIVYYKDNKNNKDDRKDKNDRDNRNNRDDRDNKDDNSPTYRTYPTYYPYLSYLNDREKAANCVICLIHQAAFLVDQQLRAVEKSYSQSDEVTVASKIKQRQKQIDEGEKWLQQFLKDNRLSRNDKNNKNDRDDKDDRDDKKDKNSVTL